MTDPHLSIFGIRKTKNTFRNLYLKMLAQITSDSLEIVRKKNPKQYSTILETIKRSYALSGVSLMQGASKQNSTKNKGMQIEKNGN